MAIKWQGVMPAITTCFNQDLTIDHAFQAKHVRWLVDHGCTGIVTPGSLGEGATLTFEEKRALWQTSASAAGSRAPVIAAIAALSTAEAVELAKSAQDSGCQGLMVLPPYVYNSDWREMKAHVEAVVKATKLPCMLYNNPVAYGTDFLPEHIEELAAENENLEAVKESSTDVRRIAAIRALLGEQFAVLVGVDDVIVEAIAIGATGWIAGLVNALPSESVALVTYARANDPRTFELYRWFLPLLRMDTVPKFVQLIKLVQQAVGMGNTRVRPPRLSLPERSWRTAEAVIRQALETRPVLS
jgi:4-hydroxy-tetrahydrodipicolinate synthase